MGFVSWWKGEKYPKKQSLIDSFLDMPFILKILTFQTFIACGIFLLFAYPNAGITLNGRQVTYEYLLSSGAVWVFAFSGIIWPVSGYMMLRRKMLSRMAYLGAMGFFMIGVGLVDPVMHLVDIIWMTSAQTGILCLYLYKRKPVVEYFRKTA